MHWRRCSPNSRASRHRRAPGRREIIPSRIVEYEPQWLDEHCRAGRVRLDAARRARSGHAGADPERSHGASPIRSTPITLMARRNVPLWAAMADHADPVTLTSRARAVADFIREHGASFFDEIADHVGMLPVEVEDALAELVALGMVNSDSFAGLRVLLMPSGRRGKSNSYTVRRKRRLALFGMADAGRWALVRRPAAGARAQRRGGRTHRAHAAAPLGRDFLETSRPRSRLAAAVARHAHVLPPLGGAGRDSRRPVCRGLLGRAIRDARGRGTVARRAPQAANPAIRCGVGRRSA